MSKMAIAYGMKRKKMADGGTTDDAQPTAADLIVKGAGFGPNAGPKPSPKPRPSGTAMSRGGDINQDSGETGFEKGVHTANYEGPGSSMSGSLVRSKTSVPKDIRVRTAKDEAKRVLSEMRGIKPNLPMAEGGQITDNYQSDYLYRDTPDLADHEKESGFLAHEGNTQRPNDAAMLEDDKDLNQHGEEDCGPYGAMAHGGDIVDRVMAKRYSEGGKVANATPITAGFKPDEFDDLVLRDGLSSNYGDDDNSGDALGNEREDADRRDIVSRIMASRAKRDRMPRPA